MTPAEFHARFGFEPQQDDLHRATCEQAGSVGHWQCGVCQIHNKPRFMCGCPWTAYLQNFHAPMIEVSHATLVRRGGSSYKSLCSLCSGGLLLVYRNQKTFELQRADRCIRCAQRFYYTDETINGERFEK